jgi:hypothetical protein
LQLIAKCISCHKLIHFAISFFVWFVAAKRRIRAVSQAALITYDVEPHHTLASKLSNSVGDRR